MFKEFLTTFCGCSEDSQINYKVVQYRNIIEHLTVNDANEKMMQDFDDFFNGWGLEREKAFCAAIHL